MSNVSIFEHEAKIEAVFAVIDKRCGHRWGSHAINGCKTQGCNCKENGINAVRSMMKDPKFKYNFTPPIPKEKEMIQVKLQ